MHSSGLQSSPEKVICLTCDAALHAGNERYAKLAIVVNTHCKEGMSGRQGSLMQRKGEIIGNRAFMLLCLLRQKKGK